MIIPENSDAKKAIDALTRRFFDAFTNKDGAHPEVASLRHLLIPRALIVKNVGSTPEYFSVDDFIAPREKLLTDGTLVEFSEEELSERTDIFGNIAQRFCAYRKSGVLSGVPFAARGMKTLQFVRTPDGWKISAVAWDDEA